MFSKPVVIAAAAAAAVIGLIALRQCRATPAAALPGGLTAEDVANLRRTWALVNGDLKSVAALFYRNLFTANPEFPKTLFKNVDMSAQGGRLMSMVGSGVALIDQPHVLVPVLQASGIRHVAYGVVDAQYKAVGAAFLQTLRAGLGAEFTPAVESAWTKYYTVAAQVMMDAANSPKGREQAAAADLRRRNRLVQDSWELVTSADDFTQRFYKHLFTANPSLPETQFKGVNMSEQRKKLAAMIDGGVKLLNRVDELVPILKASGARHVRYGTKPEHYPLVGAALLATLKDTLGAAKWTPELEREWTRVYGLMADTMIQGAQEAAATA